MAGTGGYWGKGNNPYSNFDYDSASRDRQMHRIQGEAHQERLDNEIKRQQQDFEFQKLEQESSTDLSKMRIRMNATIASHKKEINAYEQRLDNMAQGLYKLAIRSNIFQRTLIKLQEKWPEKKEDILDEIQTQKDYCLRDEYQNTWWNWAKDFKNVPNHTDAYFDFPFEKRPSPSLKK